VVIATEGKIDGETIRGRHGRRTLSWSSARDAVMPEWRRRCGGERRQATSEASTFPFPEDIRRGQVDGQNAQLT